MDSLFTEQGAQKIIDRILRLDSARAAEWGKMSSAQMIAHAQRPLQVAQGELQLNQGLIGLLFGKMLKKKFAGPEPFKKNLPTAPQFLIKDQPDFMTERSKLIRLLEDFTKHKEQTINSKHPFFGKMTAEEWDHLQWKHLDHHLRQFGV